MKKFGPLLGLKTGLAIFGAMTTMTATAFASPSTTYWTPMVMDIQAYKVPHLGIDNYFTVDKKADSGEQGAFPTDVGVTIGVLPYEKVQMEVGIDALYPSDDPYFFNAKIGASEGKLFEGAPALQIGIFNVGPKKGVTDQNIVYGVIGKTIPSVGRLSAGPYTIGNSKDWGVSTDKSGFMVAFDHRFATAKDAAGNEYSKWVFAADYASGKNAIGGGGFGMYYYFTKDISLLTGPVWFNEKAINGAWKWTTQLDINF